MQPAKIDPRDRLIVPLDLPSVEAAEAMIGKLGDAVTMNAPLHRRHRFDVVTGQRVAP